MLKELTKSNHIWTAKKESEPQWFEVWGATGSDDGEFFGTEGLVHQVVLFEDPDGSAWGKQESKNEEEAPAPAPVSSVDQRLIQHLSGGAAAASAAAVPAAPAPAIAKRMRQSSSAVRGPAPFVEGYEFFRRRPEEQHESFSSQRAAALERYKKKKAGRDVHVAQMRRDKRVRYESRKNIADHRPRVKGRFVKTASEIVNNTTLGK